MSYTDRVIVLVDMDCFYCQVEEKLNSELAGKPIAVVQYNAWKGGGIIAVNYAARDKGVTRHMRGDEAKHKCPELNLVSVPTLRGKSDLTKYRDAGKKVAEVLQSFTALLERASVDEAYLDITEAVKQRMEFNLEKITLEQIKNTHVVGHTKEDFLYNLYEDYGYSAANMKLAYGGVITEEVRAAVYEKTGYRCSAGVAHNKVLAKLACGLHKPNQQTVLPHDSVEQLFKDLPLRKIRSLGGKFGLALTAELGIQFAGQLLQFSEKELIQKFDEKSGTWLYNIARGIDREPVTVKLISKSIGCCKNFSGQSALKDSESVFHWVTELASEIAERLEKDYEENNRKAKQMTIGFIHKTSKKDVSASRAHYLSSYDATKIASDVFEVIKKNCMKANGTFHIKYLAISTGKFEDLKNVNEITSFFKVSTSKPNTFPDSNVASCSVNNSPKRRFGNIDNYLQLVNKSFVSVEAENLIHNDSVVQQDEESKNPRINSRYSDTTEEMIYDSDQEIIFYDDRVENKSSANIKVSSETNEKLNLSLDDSKEPPKKKQSFFKQYIANLKMRKKAVEEANSNLNESKDIFSEEEQSSEQDETFPFAKEAAKVFNDLINEPSTSRHWNENTDQKETCKECKKNIPVQNMVAHMDYHLALKMVREEASLYKESPKLLSETGSKNCKNNLEVK